MENNNTPRKARIYYESESIPVLVVDECDWNYVLLLDGDTLTEEEDTLAEAVSKRNLYLDALFGWEGAHEIHKHVSAFGATLILNKDNPEVPLVFAEPEPEEAQGEPTEMIDPDNVVPQIDMHGELNQHLTLLARSGYKVKSFDVTIQEGGEAHLCATYTKEVDK